jgi:predicted ATPase
MSNSIESMKIEDYCNFNHFKINFENSRDGNLNLNLLVGRNGSGKSTFLDCLYDISSEIVTENIKNKFGFEINQKKVNDEFISNEDVDLWDRVIRFYTGNTERNKDIISYKDTSDKVFNLQDNEALLSFITLCSFGLDDVKYKVSGKEKNEEESTVKKYDEKIFFNEINDLISNDCNQKSKLIINNIWIKIYSPENEKLEWLNNFIEPDFIIKNTENIKTLYWSLRDNNSYKKILKDVESEQAELKKIDLFSRLLEARLKSGIIDFGFIYTHENSKDLLMHQTLSDGEIGLISRLSLLKLFSEINNNGGNEKLLILLDEPETHFNEYWKTKLLKCIVDYFEDDETNHDIFISTHSAMLVTDAKPEELTVLLKDKDNEITCINGDFKTYGANTIDIGQILFKMDGTIGERAKKEIENAILDDNKKILEDLLEKVGPGEHRWRIRARLNELRKKASEEDDLENKIIKKLTDEGIIPKYKQAGE